MSHHPSMLRPVEYWLPNSSENYGGRGVEREREKELKEKLLPYSFNLKFLRHFFSHCHIITNSVTLVSLSKGRRGDRKETLSQWHFHSKLQKVVIALLNNSGILSLSSAQCLKISALVRIIVKRNLWLPFKGLRSENLQFCKYLYQGSLH